MVTGQGDEAGGGIHLGRRPDHQEHVGGPEHGFGDQGDARGAIDEEEFVLPGKRLEEATELASQRPDTWSVGKGGWAILKFDPAERPQEGLLERWIEESYRLQAPKKVLAALDAG